MNFPRLNNDEQHQAPVQVFLGGPAKRGLFENLSGAIFRSRLSVAIAISLLVHGLILTLQFDLTKFDTSAAFAGKAAEWLTIRLDALPSEPVTPEAAVLPQNASPLPAEPALLADSASQPPVQPNNAPAPEFTATIPAPPSKVALTSPSENTKPAPELQVRKKSASQAKPKVSKLAKRQDPAPAPKVQSSPAANAAVSPAVATTEEVSTFAFAPSPPASSPSTNTASGSVKPTTQELDALAAEAQRLEQAAQDAFLIQEQQRQEELAQEAQRKETLKQAALKQEAINLGVWAAETRVLTNNAKVGEIVNGG